MEAYAAYALRAWLAHDQAVSTRTRRFAEWSAIFSFALGMAGHSTSLGEERRLSCQIPSLL